MKSLLVYRGATLTELITVILLTGIIAAFAAPRFFTRNDFDARGFFELSIQAVRYAQKYAIASGCNVQVKFTGTGFSLSQWISGGSCAAPGAGLTTLEQPGGGKFADTAPGGVNVGTALFYFDQIGRPRDVSSGNLLSAATTISVGGRIITVYPETGFVRCTAGC